MEWYEALICALLWFAGIWIYGKYSNSRKSKYHNDSWKKK